MNPCPGKPELSVFMQEALLETEVPFLEGTGSWLDEGNLPLTCFQSEGTLRLEWYH